MPWSSTFRYHHGTTVFRVPPCSGVALFPPHTRERLATSNGSRGTNASPFLLFVPSICFVCGCSVNCGSTTRRFIEQRGQLFFPFSFGLDNELTGVSSTQKSLRHCEKDGASTFVRCCYVQPRVSLLCTQIAQLFARCPRGECSAVERLSRETVPTALC